MENEHDHLADGVLYVEREVNTTRGPVRTHTAIGSVVRVGEQGLRLRVERIHDGNHWIDLATPLHAKVKLPSAPEG